MRFPDQSLIGDLNDDITPRVSASIYPPPLVSTTDENDTTYDLLPVIINRPPIITKPIAEASTPQIRPYSTADATGEYMYLFPDGTVKVNIGANFKLAIEAIQPNILNVENGILRLIPPNSNLTFAWRKDSDLLNSSTSTTLQSTVTVSGSYIEFENIQPSSAGTYLCEITNDIGTTTSETITLEVLNLDFDTLFYRNLVKNPTGADGTNEWNANNSDLDAKPFSRIPSQDLSRPNRVDLFGYTIDMMHPRPYQIDMGMIQNFDMTQVYLNNPNYFTRTRYKFDRKNGSFHVKAYQDIDLTDIIPLIKGGVYGVEGVRALFSCYIGNGVSQYIPIEEMVDPRRRVNPVNYYVSYARLSLQNFLSAGPAYGIYEKAYVTIEEFDNETRVPTTLLINNIGGTRQYNSRIAVEDPWQKRIYNTDYQRSVYPDDIYGLGETSPNDYRDIILNVSSTLYPDERGRYTYGQYVEFNKLIVERLNPKTTKVRITLNFESTDWRLFETPAELINDSDEIFETTTWETPYKKNKFSRPPLSPTYKPIYQRIKNYSGSFGKTPSEFFPAAQDPRVMITGLNFVLLPILTQQNTLTDYYTRITLATNSTPTSSFTSGLSGVRIFDPRRVFAVPLMLDFRHSSEGAPRLDNLGYLQQRDILELKVRIGNEIGSPNTLDQSLFTDYQIANTGLLPFAANSIVAFQGAEEEAITSEDIDSFTTFNDYIRYRLISPYQSQRDAQTPSFNTVANRLASYNYTVLGMSGSIAPSQELEVERPWTNTARFVLQYGVVGATIPIGEIQPRLLTTSQIGGQPTETQVIQSYYLDIDFSNPADTKVTLSRPLSVAQFSTEIDLGFIGTVSVNTSQGSKYGGQGVTPTPIELEHTITPYGVLQCTIPGSLKFTSMADGGFGFSGYRYQFTIQDRSPIRCIELLHTNLGDFSKVPLTDNTYYQSRLNAILTPITNDIQIIQTFPNGGRAAFYNSRGITVSDLRSFSLALAIYGYDKTRVPNASQYTTIINALSTSSFTINIFEPFFYPDRNTWTLTVTNYQTQQLIAGIRGGNVSIETADEDIEFDKFIIPPHLQGMRNDTQKIELLAIRPADPDLGPSGTPASGISADGIRFNVYQSPLQDTSEGGSGGASLPGGVGAFDPGEPEPGGSSSTGTTTGGSSSPSTPGGGGTSGGGGGSGNFNPGGV